ncbi:MAG: response regulator [Gammaproteobacteria bacterium]|nr:response regulator [Gammaproteobacteria bacterium]
MVKEQSTISNALEELRKSFFNGIPTRLDKLNELQENLYDCDDTRTRHDLLQKLNIAYHSLAGTSATYGYHDISKHAKAAERYLKQMDPTAKLSDEAMDKLQAYQQAIFIDIDAYTEQPLSNQKLRQIRSHIEANRKPDNILIYIADEDRHYTEQLSHLLSSTGLKNQAFNTLYELEQRIRFQEPTLVILNSEFAGDSFAGFEFISQLAENSFIQTPTIFISENTSLEHKYRATSIRSSFYLPKPIDITDLIQSIDLVISRIYNDPYRIMIVDDDHDHAQYITTILNHQGFNALAVNDATQVLDKVSEFQPEVILMDLHMPGFSGIELTAMLRLDPKQQFTSVLFLSIETDPNQQLEAINLGGDDFLTKPIDPNLVSRTVEIRAQRARAFRKAYFDLNHTINELEQFKISLDQHAIVSIADATGNITYVNKLFCDISGYSEEELLGQNHRILNSGYHDHQFFINMWQTIATGHTWQGVIKNHTKDGSEYWVESTITPILDDSGKPYQYVSIRTDITEQQITSENLARSEERLRQSQQYANIGTWDLDIHSNELFWSERIGPLFGYDEVVETNYDNFINAVHPDDRQLVINAVDDCIEHGKPYDIEHRIIRSDGEVRWLSERGDVTRDNDYKPLHMLGVVQDITARKQAEQALKASQTNLIQAQKQAMLGNWEANLKTGELYWSNVIYEIFGLDPETYTPSIEAFHLTVHPDDRNTVLQCVKDAETSGLQDIVHRIIRPDGEVRYVHELARVQYDDHGKATTLLGTVQDITNLKRVEEKLIAAKEEAEAANQAKSDFLSRMSHELRTPMNAILGFAQLMESDDDDPLSEGQLSSMDQILKASWHLLNLINEVLDLSRIESGNLEISLESVDAHGVINECLQLSEAQARQRQITVHYSNSKPRYVWADYTRLKQVVLNLITNAIKYNKNGGSINIDCHPHGERVRIEIRDTGIGIAEDKINHLFEPFNRLGADRTEIEGTGIGLVISRRLVEIMGGDIGVDSTYGEGSVFFFDLAMAEAHASEESTDEETTENTGTENNGDYNILYVEDNPANLTLVQHILSRIEGVSLHTETSGIDGLSTARRMIPDLIILDINLPEMEGTEIAQALKADTNTQDIPLIAISANAMPSDINRALNVGFEDYLTKPINVEEFIEVINKHRLSSYSNDVEF